ncbi:MAG: hypothetical protein WCP85_15010 [Mariniphaga sp.]
MIGRRWSKLKKKLENLFEPTLNIEFNCSSYPVRSQRGGNSIPRFYMQIDKEIIWDFPRDFELRNIQFSLWASQNEITDLIQEYIETPVDQLLTTNFKYETITIEDDWLLHLDGKRYEVNYHLTELFIAADRRIGKQKLIGFAALKSNEAIDTILEKRFGSIKPLNT